MGELTHSNEHSFLEARIQPLKPEVNKRTNSPSIHSKQHNIVRGHSNNLSVERQDPVSELCHDRVEYKGVKQESLTDNSKMVHTITREIYVDALKKRLIGCFSGRIPMRRDKEALEGKTRKWKKSHLFGIKQIAGRCIAKEISRNDRKWEENNRDIASILQNYFLLTFMNTLRVT